MGSKTDFSGKKTPNLYDLHCIYFSFVYIHPMDKETVSENV